MLFYTVCSIYTVLAGTCGLTSICTMSFISLERLAVVGDPYKRFISNGHKKMGLCLLITWLYGFFWASLPVIGFGRYALDGIGTSCTFHYTDTLPTSKAYVAVLFVFGFTVPFSTAVFSYSKLCWTVWRHERNLKSDIKQMKIQSFRAIQKQKNSRCDVRLTKLTVCILTLFCMAWLPYSIVALMGLTGHAGHLNPYVSLIPVIFAKTSAIYNPFAYVIGYASFRRKMFACMYKKHSHVQYHWPRIIKPFPVNEKNGRLMMSTQKEYIDGGQVKTSSRSSSSSRKRKEKGLAFELN